MSQFEPSGYQKGVFQHLVHGQGNFVVSAVAGSGKTTTLERAIALLPGPLQCNTWVVAFNKAIAEETARRQQIGRFPAGVTISTFHSMGFRILRAHYEVRGQGYMNNLKYFRLLDAAWNQQFRLGRIPKPDRKDDKFKVANKCAGTLVSLCQSTLTEPTRESLMLVAAHYEVELPALNFLEPVVDVVRLVLTWGRDGMPEPDREGRRYRPSEHVAFADQIWLPATDAKIDRPHFNLILVDEAQDLNRCQLELALSCLAPGGRIGFVGDRHQAIYGFAGADCRSIDYVIERTKARELPLSICYRCPTTVIALAKRLVPEIEAAPGAPLGNVEWTDRTEILARAAGDWQAFREPWLVMCRTNAPLLSAAVQLLKRRVPVYIRGREFAEQLLADVDTIAALDEYSDATIMQAIGLYESRRLEQLKAADASDAAIDALLDRLQCVRIVTDELITRKGSTSAEAVKQVLNTLIPEQPTEGVVFSSIHRAKGLEARYAAILRADLLPHPRVSGGWQMTQEANLAYVAITRAKEELWIEGEFGFRSLRLS